MNLKKVGLILKREYITRIRKKSFILTTLLIPIGFMLVFFIPLGMQLLDTSAEGKVAILDKTGKIYPSLASRDSSRYLNYSEYNYEDARRMVMQDEIDGFVVFTRQHLESRHPEFIYDGKGGLSFITGVKSDIQAAIRRARINQMNISSEVRRVFEESINIEARTLNRQGEEKTSNTEFFSLFGFFLAMVIYLAMFIYGAIIMRSVIEEKSNRIVEIITSSVKPIELMVGKVLGVGALGLTQFLIWIIMGVGLLTALVPVTSFLLGPEVFQTLVQSGGNNISVTQHQFAGNIQIPSIGLVFWFYLLLYFIMGYLIYSALFAAVGSAVDSESETQQFMIPVTIPIIIAIILMPQVTSAPDSTFAVISSLIPLFSPILMVARLPITEVPFWQTGSSFLLMAATYTVVMWLSARIYRTGILMYGKKVTFKEIVRWIRH